MKILLASGSPRRRDLLLALGHDVVSISADIAEVEECADGEVADVAMQNAKRKAESVFLRSGLADADVLVAADTIVTLGGHIFGKPRNAEAARSMLEKLSGKSHQVITGYCIIAPQHRQKISHVTSSVRFRYLSEQEISAYVRFGEGADKAGGYAIQGAGAALIQEVLGSVSNVVGLPVEALLEDIRELRKT